MKYRLIPMVAFCLVLVHAEAEEHIKSMRQLVDNIGQTDYDVFTFIKNTIEEEPSNFYLSSNIHLNLSGKIFKSANNTEMIGKYLSSKTEKEICTQIEQDCNAEGTNLLNDFFDTSMYKEFRKRLEHFVFMMTSCNFLTPEESKILRESKIFYPDNYEAHEYTWELVHPYKFTIVPDDKKIDGFRGEYFIDYDKINGLSGELHKIIGLKRIYKDIEDWSSENNFKFIVAIDVTYSCLRQETIIRGPKDTVLMCHIKPQPSMFVTITFLIDDETRYENPCKTVSFTCQAIGGERLSRYTKNETLPESSMVGDFDLQSKADDPIICGQCKIGSKADFITKLDFRGELQFSCDAMKQCSDFIIETKNPTVI